MPISFPAALDTLTNPTPSDNLNTVTVLHSTQHANLNDAVEALQAKVGIDASGVATSLDYLLRNAASSNPGHKHTTAAITDYTAPPAAANPTGTIGLSAVSGSASTFLRSDGAPALSQAIAPTWTGQHIWSLSNAAAVSIGPNGDTNPTLRVVTNVASAVNGLAITGAASGSEVIVAAISPDSSVGMCLRSKSNGLIRFQADSNNFAAFSGANGGLTLANSVFGPIGWSATTDVSAARDTAFFRTAPGVGEVNDGTATQLAWLRTAGHHRLTADVTNATTTMANLTGLSVTLKARTYRFLAILYVEDSVAADGVKLDFDGGTATATLFIAHGTVFDTSLLLSTQTTALATDLAAATVTGRACIEIHGYITVNAAGTFIPRAAQNSHTAGTLTVYTGSSIDFWETTA